MSPASPGGETLLDLGVHSLLRQGGRAYQEDALGYRVAQGVACLVVADGAGGHGGGDLASQLVVRAILEQHVRQPACSAPAVQALIAHAHLVVLAGQQRFAQHADMRSTVALALVDLHAGAAVLGNVGDTRGYGFSGPRLVCQTRDHSLVQQMVDAGMIRPEQIRGRPERNVLTSSLGSPGDVEPHVQALAEPLRPGDAVLLCTDGLWEHVTEDEMQDVLALGLDGDRQLAYFERWVEERGPVQNDNFSALLALFGPPEADPDSTIVSQLCGDGDLLP